MQLEAGKRYKTRGNDIVYILNRVLVDVIDQRYDWMGYIIRYQYDTQDRAFEPHRTQTWYDNGTFLREQEHDYDLVKEYKEPRSGQVKLWVYESASHGLFYYTTEIDADKPYGELHPSERLLCAQIVDWKENGETS